MSPISSKTRVAQCDLGPISSNRNVVHGVFHRLWLPNNRTVAHGVLDRF